MRIARPGAACYGTAYREGELSKPLNIRVTEHVGVVDMMGSLRISMRQYFSSHMLSSAAKIVRASKAG